jgi:class 3 adenylate cyclase
MFPDSKQTLPVDVRTVLEAEALRGERATFLLRTVFACLGILAALAVANTNRSEATLFGLALGSAYLGVGLLGLWLLRRGRSGWPKYLGVVADTLVVLLATATSLFNHSGAYEALLAPVFPMLHVAFCILTTLHYSVRLSLFAGLISALGRGIFLSIVIAKDLVRVSDVAVYGKEAVGLEDQVVIIVFIAVSGAMAAWAAHSSRRLLVKYAEDTARKSQLERRQGELSRYLSAQTLDRVIATHEGPPEDNNQRHLATLLFVRITGMGRLLDRHDPERYLAILNEHLGDLANSVFRYGGSLDKFTPEGLMAVFGFPYDVPDAAGSAVRAAIDMYSRAQRWSDDGTSLSVGIAQGVVVAGNIGTADRLEFTVVGRAVTSAHELQELSAKLKEPILVNEAVKDSLTGYYRTRLVPPEQTGRSEAVFVVELDAGGDTMLSPSGHPGEGD